MLYVEYENYKNKLHKSQQVLDEIISEKEKLFAKTQPQSTNLDKEPTKGGVPGDKFFEYVKEIIDNKIEERIVAAKSIVKDREELLLSKEEELRRSKNEYDIIYTYYFLEYKSIRQIERKIYKSKSEIDRKLQKIKENLQLGTKQD